MTETILDFGFWIGISTVWEPPLFQLGHKSKIVNPRIEGTADYAYGTLLEQAWGQSKIFHPKSKIE